MLVRAMYFLLIIFIIGYVCGIAVLGDIFCTSQMLDSYRFALGYKIKSCNNPN